MQEFKERQAIVTQAESLAASYGTREAALAAREQKVASQEDTSQHAAAAAEYARNEAEAMWQKQKVCPCTSCSMAAFSKHSMLPLNSRCSFMYGLLVPIAAKHSGDAMLGFASCWACHTCRST